MLFDAAEWSGVPWSRVVEHGVKQAKLRAAIVNPFQRQNSCALDIYSCSFSLITTPFAIIISSTILSHLNEARLHELT